MSAAPRTSRRKLGPAPVQTAKVQELAKREHSQVNLESSSEKKILDTIKKCLTKANHPNTAESEAKTAWSMATRLMQRYNVTQADLLEQATNEDGLAVLGGHSVVSISRAKDDGRRVTHQTWVNDVGVAMKTFFNCDYYTTARATSLEFTFFGIAANTIPAAMAFEMAHNLALEWARTKGGGKNSYCVGIGEGMVKQAQEEKRLEKQKAEQMERKQREKAEQTQRSTVFTSSRVFFGDPVDGYEDGRGADRTGDRSGISHALASPSSGNHNKPVAMVEDLEDEYPQQASIKSEEEDEKSTIKSEGSDSGYDRAFPFTPCDIDDDDNSLPLDQGYASDEDEMEMEPTFKEEDEKPIDLEADFEEQLRQAKPIQKSATPDIPEKDGVDDIDDAGIQLTTNTWNTSQALVRFRQSAEKVATEYLKAQNVKLGKAKKRKRTIRNDAVYREGVADSKKIDVKRRRIEGANAKEKYCSNCGRYLLVGPLAPEYPGLPTKVECHCIDA